MGDRRFPILWGDAEDGDAAIFWRYIAHQVPGWIAVGGAAAVAAHLDWIASVWVLGLVAIVVAKDLLMYPWMRVAYSPTRLHGPESLVARLAQVEFALDPAGHVRVGPELWRARCEPFDGPIERGEVVIVREVRGLELVVDRSRDGDTPTGPA
jgi:membrane protein implicated in regulation of membrane protease activity